MAKDVDNVINVAQLFADDVIAIAHRMDDVLNPYIDTSMRGDIRDAYVRGTPKAQIVVDILNKYVIRQGKRNE